DLRRNSAQLWLCTVWEVSSHISYQTIYFIASLEKLGTQEALTRKRRTLLRLPVRRRRTYLTLLRIFFGVCLSSGYSYGFLITSFQFDCRLHSPLGPNGFGQQESASVL